MVSDAVEIPWGDRPERLVEHGLALGFAVRPGRNSASIGRVAR
jgi:hypothetical protein